MMLCHIPHILRVLRIHDHSLTRDSMDIPTKRGQAEYPTGYPVSVLNLIFKIVGYGTTKFIKL